MTSPTRADASMSLLEGERLSPIKIPESDIIDHTNHVEMQSGLSPTSLLGKHPHGLTAKHGAKSGHHHTSLTNTPVTHKSDLKPLSGMKRAPLTSPRRNVNPNLDSLRKSKANLDSRLLRLRSDNSPADKENVRHDSSFGKYIVSSPQYQNSSPTAKRHTDGNDDTPRKIAKVVTNANEDRSSHSIQVDEVFNKEDLVGQISAGNSPKKQKTSQILDEDSDSGLETYPVESQTNYKLSKPTEELTQQSRILRISGTGHYITPQRFTEPVAKSPQTDQQIRLTKDVPLSDDNNPKSLTSPTKYLASKAAVAEDNDQDDESSKQLNDENEPTINFLMSPNSKPVFSLDHIKKIKNDHYAEVKSLETIISNKNQEILNFSQELNATNSKFLEYDQVIKDLKLAKKMLLDNEELLQVQLKHNERELASSNKRLKIKSNQLALLEEKVKLTETQLNELNRTYEETSKLFERLQRELEDHQLKFKEFSRIKQENEATITALQKNEENLKIKLIGVKNENESSLQKIEGLNKEVTDLKEIVTGQEELLNRWEQELQEDKRLREEHDRNKEAEIYLLKEENENLRSTVKHLEESNREDEASKEEKQKLKEALQETQEQLNEAEDTNSTLKDQLQKLKTDYEESQLLIVESNKTIDSLKTSNSEKDEIIRGDTKGMSELTDKINQLKQTIVENEKRMKESNDDGNADIELLKKQIEEYKKQNEENRSRTNAKIHEVAEHLYKEYSKKHELKVSQLKSTFQKQLDALKIEKNSHRRDVESLQKKLELVNMEKEQLLKLTRGKSLLTSKTTRKPRN